MGTIGKAPAASIRGRQHDRQADNSPGPGKYLVEGDLGKNARNALSIRSRHPLKSSTASPGPAYSIPSTIGKAPAASIRGRQHERQADNSPGPGKYLVEGDLGKNARNAPSIRSRHPLKSSTASP